MSALPRRIMRRLPPTWRQSLAAVPAQRVPVGMSGAKVYRLPGSPGRYLKIGLDDAAARIAQENARTAWLAAHGVRVPRIVDSFVTDDAAAMLTNALPGVAAADSDQPPEHLVMLIGRALGRLHALSIDACSFDESVAVRLARAEQAIAAGEVDPKHFASRNRNTPPGVLLDRLRREAPAPDPPVVVHGDATLDNMIVADDGAIGFIDCGHAGRGDRYLDLAVVADDIADRFGPQHVAPFACAAGRTAWDTRRAAYFTDLYELF